MTENSETFALVLTGRATTDLAGRVQRDEVSVADLAAYFAVFREYGALIAVAAEEQGLSGGEADAWILSTKYEYRKQVEAFMLKTLDDWRKHTLRGKGFLRKFMSNTLPQACFSEVFPEDLRIEWHQRYALHNIFDVVARTAGLKAPAHA